MAVQMKHEDRIHEALFKYAGAEVRLGRAIFELVSMAGLLGAEQLRGIADECLRANNSQSRREPEDVRLYHDIGGALSSYADAIETDHESALNFNGPTGDPIVDNTGGRI